LFQGVTSGSWFFVYSGVGDFVDGQDLKVPMVGSHPGEERDGTVSGTLIANSPEA
jgi:hypothetical protein